MKRNYIGIREARINLSRLLRDVRGGMEIIITDRGTPVARLLSAESITLTLEERIKNYESCGLIDMPSERKKSQALPVELPDGFLEIVTGEDREND